MNDISNDTSSIDDVVSEPTDAIINVSISTDKLQASVNISPPLNGGAGPNNEALMKTIADHKITYGIDKLTLLYMCREPVYDTNIIIARGIEPIHGIDGTFEILFHIVKELKPKQREDGSVDFQNLTFIENVKKDQILCTITPPIEGKDGISVNGKKIKHIKGKALSPLLGKNTKLNEEGTAILSTIDGQVEYQNGRIIVEETLYIKDDVDNSTGNINVTGNVIINGIVLPGFTVEASGNIQINGGVNSATLIAGGNVVLPRGINGGKVDCKGNFTSRFIENCCVSVQGNIETDYIMNSNVTCGKSIITSSSRSKIVGGSYLAGENIEARIIGSSAGISTYLEIRVDPALIKKLGDLSKENTALEEQLNSLESLIALLEQFQSANQLTDDKEKMLEDAVFSHKQITDSLAINKEESEQISSSIKSNGYGHIKSGDSIHPGTVAKIGPFRIKIYDTLSGKSLYHSDKGIVIKNTK